MKKKFLIVLDLNGTLLHRLTKPADIHAARAHPKHCEPDSKLSTNKQPVYMRPHLATFLNTLSGIENVEVAIWTSAMEKNAQAMLNCIDSFLKNKNGREYNFKFVWGQSKCTAISQANDPKPLFLKPISQIIQEYPLVSKEDILIIDDSQEKFLEEDRMNHLCLPEFTVCEEEVDFTQDSVLSVLSNWFIQMQKTIEPKEKLVSYLKRNPPAFNSNSEAEIAEKATEKKAEEIIAEASEAKTEKITEEATEVKTEKINEETSEVKTEETLSKKADGEDISDLMQKLKVEAN